MVSKTANKRSLHATIEAMRMNNLNNNFHLKSYLSMQKTPFQNIPELETLLSYQ